MRIDEAIERYRSQLELLNYSSATIKAQTSYLERFGRFLVELAQEDALAVTSAQLQAFQRDVFYRPTVTGSARGVGSQNQILIAVKNLYRFLTACRNTGAGRT